MKRNSLTLALCVSALLIIGATWFRVREQTRAAGNLIVVNGNAAETEQVDQFLAANVSATSTLSSTEDLNQTDLFGRQYVSNFLSLSMNGQATDQNIDTLADSFANSAVTLSTYMAITREGITTVDATKENLQSYGDAVSTIYNKYRALAGQAIQKGGDLGSVESKNFASAMTALSKLSAQAAADLQKVPAPSSLANNHLALINNYLSNAEALGQLANIAKDPVSAYAALNTQAINGEAELALLATIKTTLLGQGIAFSTDI